MQQRTVAAVYFENGFWRLAVERWQPEGACAAVYTFGAEPTDAEVYQFVLNCFDTLEGAAAMAGGLMPKECVNPKRRQRLARRLMEQKGPGTKAQQALQQQRELDKWAAARRKRAAKREREAAQYSLRQQKKKQKHKGR